MRHRPALSRALAVALTASLIPVLAVVLTAPPARADDPKVALTKSGPAQILAGEKASYQLNATNVSPDELYNLTFRDVLPVGVTYVGPTSPKSFGEPRIVEAPVTKQQTLIWTNVSDLPPGSTQTLSFDVRARTELDCGSPEDYDDYDPEDGSAEHQACLAQPIYPVGAGIVNEGYAYASEDERELPHFSSSGEFDPEHDDNEKIEASPKATSSTTTVSALQISKSTVGLSEQELLRGVHDNAVTYQLRIRNTGEGATTGIVVTDYLPAGLELLGCGDVTDAEDEYPGSGTQLDPGTPLSEADGCIEPATVETVELTEPTAVEGQTLPPGVYTKITWAPFALGGSEPSERVLRYRAAIPRFANTDFDGPAPDTDGWGHAGTLANNPEVAVNSTRETATEESLPNHAFAEGTYNGAHLGGSDPIRVTAHGSTSVTVEDVAMVKAVADVWESDATFPGTPMAGHAFVAGGIVAYRLTIQTSEYARADSIVVTDTLPDGVCLLGFGADTASYDPNDECESAVGGPHEPTLDPGGPGRSVVVDGVALHDDVPAPSPALSAGESRVTFRLDGVALAHDDEVEVTYYARMRNDYTRGSQTVSGDSYTNRARLDATSYDRFDGSPEAVTDDSSATLSSDSPHLSKKALRRQPDATCLPGGSLAQYSSETLTQIPVLDGNGDPVLDGDGQPVTEEGLDPDFAFRPGDQICFLVEVDFADFNHTRNPIVTDFLPNTVDYDPTYANGTGDPGWFLAPGNTITDPADIVFTPTYAGPGNTGRQNPLRWRLGEEIPSGDRIVPAGAKFTVIIPAIVNGQPNSSSIDLTGNLAKLRWSDTEGNVSSERTDLDFGVEPAPPVSLDKSAKYAGATIPDDTAIDGTVNDRTVRYTLRVQHGGTELTSNDDVPIESVRVWDVLPAGVLCAQVTPANGGTCYDDGSGGYPSYNGPPDGPPTGRSVVVWTIDELPIPSTDPDPAYAEVTYVVDYPATIRVGSELTNTAAVVDYDTLNNRGVPEQQVPGDAGAPNLDPAHPAETWTVPSATDTETVRYDVPTVSKKVATDIVGDQNNGPTPADQETDRAVVGEPVTWTFTVTVPAGTTIHNGLLKDASIGNARFTRLSTQRFLDDGALPGGFPAQDDDLALKFPAGDYTNATSADQVFKVVYRGYFRRDDSGNTANDSLFPNTANFTSTGANASDGASVRLFQPAPSIVKDGSPRLLVGADDEVVYTIQAGNNAVASPTRPPLYDAVVTDCLPAGVVFKPGSATPAQTSGPTPGTGAAPGGNGCAVGTTLVSWSLGKLEPGTAGRQTITYTGTVEHGAGATAAYTNTATLTGSSVPSGTYGDVGRLFSTSDPETISIRPPAITKVAAEPAYTIGEQTEWTTTVTIPARVNLYDARIVDPVPATLGPVSIVSATCVLKDGADADAGPCPAPLATIAAPVESPAGTWTWSLGDVLTDDQKRVVTITYRARLLDDPPGTDPKAGDQITNTAALHWNRVEDVADSAATPLTASDAIQVREPDLGIAKTVDDATVDPKQDVTYTVTVSNTGQSAAYDVTVVDTLPAGMVVDPGSISHGGVLTPAADPAPARITWTLAGPIAAGGQQSLTYTARLAKPAPSGAQTNTVDVTEYFSLGDEDNDERRRYDDVDPAQATVTPLRPALTTVKVAQSPNNSPAYLNEATQWMVTVTNTGGSVAKGVDVVDTLPANWSLATGYTPQFSLDGGTTWTNLPIGPTNPTVAGQVLTWTDVADLPAGQALRLRFRAIPGAAAATTPGTGTTNPHVNSAKAVAKDLDDTDYESNTATAAVYVHQADLRIVKTPTGAEGVPAGWDSTALGITDTTAIPGLRYGWSLAVTNLAGTGNSTAVGPFTVVDTLPAEIPDAALSSVTVSGTGWTCNRAVRVITCTRSGNLTVGSTHPVINVSVLLPDTMLPADAPTGLKNTATVSARTHDPNTTNNTDDETATVKPFGDLAIDKTIVGTIVAGESAEWEVVVENKGPSVSRGPIEFTDTLPAGLSDVQIDWPGKPAGAWTCTTPDLGGARTFTCTHAGDLAVGAAAPTITVTADVDDDAFSVINEVALGDDPETPDPVDENNTSTTTDATTSADLAIVKQHAGGLVTAGRTFTYTLAVTNNGPSDARDVRVTDDLPAGLTFVSATGVGAAAWTCASDPGDALVDCTLDANLLRNASAAITVTVEVDHDVIGTPDPTDPDRTFDPDTLWNEAHVASAEPDPVPGNDQDTDSSELRYEADLDLTKTGAPRAQVGDTYVWDFTVANDADSPSSTRRITVTDTLPRGFYLVAPTSPGPWTCAVTGGPATPSPWDVAFVPTPATDRQTITCTTDQRVAPGDDITLAVTTRLAAQAYDVAFAADPVNPIATNDAVAEHTCPDMPGDPVDHCAGTPGEDDHSPVVDPLVDLRLTKDFVNGNEGSFMVPGGTGRYRVLVQNAGPNVDPGPVAVTDTLPPGVTYTSGSASPSSWSCAQAARVLTCSRPGPVAVGVSIGDGLSLTYDVTVADTVRADNPPGASVRNTATVDSPAKDGNTANDGDDATAPIEVPAVTITKTADEDEPLPGGAPIGYTIEVTNTSNVPAYGVEVVDTVPAGLVVDEDSIAPAGAWDGTARTITWTIAKLDPGTADKRTFTYAAALTSPVRTGNGGTAGLTNTADVTELLTQPTGGEQLDGPETTETVAPRLPQLSVTKDVLTPAPAYHDRAVTWRVTTENTGTAPAHALSVVDSLPADWSYDAGSTTWWVVTAGGGTGPAQTGPDPAGAGTGTLTWSGFGALVLAPGEKLVLTFTATPGAAADAGSRIDHVNDVTVTAEDAAGNSGYVDPDGDPVAYRDNDDATTQIHLTDLAITKTGAALATAGADYTWTLTVANVGSNVAPDNDGDAAVGPFVVTDTLPADVTLKSAPAATPGTDAWNCAAAGQVLTCTYGSATTSLAAGDALPRIPVVVTVDADLQAVANPLVDPDLRLRNTASVTGATAESDEDNNATSHTPTVVNSADLRVDKALATDPVVAGRAITWTVKVTNHGPSHSFGPITLVDDLPAGVTGVTGTSSSADWTCAASGDDWACTLPAGKSLPVDATTGVTFTFTGTVKPEVDDVTELANTATVTPSTPQTPNDERDTHTVTPPAIDTPAALVVDKSHTTDPVVAGAELTYRVKVRNDGPALARGVTIVDDLPSYLTHVRTEAVTGAGTWDCAASTGSEVDCALTSDGGDLVPSTSADPVFVEIDIVVLVDADHTLEGDPATAAKVENTVTADADNADPVTDKDDSSVTTEADLTPTKTQDAATVTAGETATYRFTVTNDGTSRHPGDFTVTDTLPAGMTVRSVTAGAGWTCPAATGQTSITCTYGPALPASGATTTPEVVLVVDVAPAAGPQAGVTNTVTVDGGPEDPDPTNDTSTVTTEIVDRANLAIEKTTPAPRTVPAGGEIAYTVRVRNNGPSTADAVRWTDVPENGLTVTAITGPTGWTCTVGGCTLTANGGALDPMAAGEWIEFTVTATADTVLDDATTLDNAATVASDTDDPEPGNNESTEQVTTTLATDLRITKTRATANVVPGRTTSFDLVVANAGPSLARGPITVTDTLPAGLTYQSHTGTGWTRDPGTGVFTYTGDLTVGVPAPTLTITVLVGPNVTGSRTNTAVVDQHADEPGDRLADNTDQATVDAAARADLAITKSHPNTPVYAGGPVTYTLGVTNNGPSDHPGPITVTDTLPVGMSATADQVAQAEGSPWSCAVAADERTVTCVRTGVLADQASASVSITATVAPDAGPATGADALVNHALVSSAVPDDDPSNDEADDPTVVTDSADLAVAKTGPATVTAGGTASYTITVTNHGPSDADDVVVADAAPTGMTITSVDVPGPAWTPTITGNGTGATITAASLPAGASRTFTVHVSLAAGLAHDADLTNTATVDSDTPDPEDGNDEGTSTSKVRNEADLTVSKTHAAGTITAGEEITYTVTPRNLGPSDTQGTITVTDTMPPGIEATAATGTGWSCTIVDDGAKVTCTTTDVVEVGDDAEPITITGLLAPDVAAGTLENVAVVAMPRDPNPANDEAVDPATVSTRADLELDKISLDQVRVGEELRYRFKVTNHGPSIARDVKVVDSLPAGLTYVSRDGAGWSCDVVDGDLVCSLAQPLAVGVTSEVTVTVLAGPAAFPAVTNVAETTSSTPDDKPENNHDTVTTPIDAYADLALTKTAVGDLVVGAEGRYRLSLRNDGPTRATAPVRITDTLPAGLSFRTGESVTGAWTCSATGQDVTCTLAGPLDNQETAVVEIVVDVLPAAEGTAVNTATASSSAEDPEPGDNTSTDTSPVLTRADLAVDKRLVGDLIAGMPATWTIDIANRGPSVSRGPITVVDRLPAGVTDPKVLASGRWSCSIAGLEITCTLPAGTDLPIGPADQIAVQATVPADRTATVTNEVEITDTTTEDPDPANDTDEVTTTPGTRADLAIAKSRVESEIIAGQRATYVLAVHNFGPSDARRVRITDTLPDGLTLVGSTGAGWTCTAAAQLVTCELDGDLADETGAEVRLEVEAAADLPPASVVNVATVDSDVPDPVEDNNSDDDDTSVDRRADLEAIKTQVTTAPVAGQELAYRLSVRNHGPSVTPGPLTLVDVLPAQLTAVRAEGEGWTCTIAEPRRVECARADGLAVDETSAPVTLTALVAADSGPATFRNSAVVAGPVIDENPANDTDYVDTTVADRTDVSLTKRVDEDTVVAGTDATYTLITHNAGPSVADNVTVVDDAPAGMSITAVSAAAPWTCSSTVARVVCERPHLGPGADAEPITVTTRVDPGVADGSELVNSARVSTSSPETDTGNNRASVPVVVLNRADLGITKTHDGSGVPGLTLPYRFTVANHGPSVAVGPITVRDVLPAGLTYVEFSGTGWTCTAGTAGAGPDGGQVVTCTYADDLPAGTAQQPVEAPQLVVLTRIEPGATGALTNTGEITDRTTDPNDDNDRDTDTVTVEPKVDLALVKSGPSAAVVGDRIAYTVEVSNAGPSTARDVVVTDTLPNGLRSPSATGDGWTCTLVERDLTCRLDRDLEVGGRAAITIEAEAGPAAYPSITNVATVTTSDDDIDPSNDTDDATTTLAGLADLAIDKSHTGDFGVGSNATYRLRVTNNGPHEALGPIVVTDTLPVGLTFGSGTGDGWSCGATDDAVTCTHPGPLAAGASLDLDLVVAVGPDAYPSVTNVATVTGPTRDADPDNDSDDDIATVTGKVSLGITKDVSSKAGRQVTYLITVTNNGPDPSLSPIKVVDQLPAELRLISVTAPGWTCQSDPAQATCVLDKRLPVGESASFSVLTQIVDGVKPGADIRNIAKVAEGNVDSPPAQDDANVISPASTDKDDEDKGGKGPGGTASDGAGLPDTGGPDQGWLLLGLLLIGLGATILVRRRRTA